MFIFCFTRRPTSRRRISRKSTAPEAPGPPTPPVPPVPPWRKAPPDDTQWPDRQPDETCSEDAEDSAEDAAATEDADAGPAAGSACSSGRADWDEEVVSSAAGNGRRRAKRRRVGSLESRASDAAHLRCGPHTLAEAFMWPRSKVQDLEKAFPDKVARLRNNLCNGIAATSDYSGIGCDQEIMWQLDKAMDGMGWNWRKRHGFRFYRACDNDPLPQSVLLHRSKRLSMNRTCLMNDIEDRLPEWAIAYLDAKMPECHADEATKKQAYADIDEWICENRAMLFNSHTASRCLVHGRDCPIALPQETSLQGYDCADADDNDDVDTAFTFGRPLRLNFAGKSCVGWSAVGQKGMYAHHSERTFSVWKNELMAIAAQYPEEFLSARVH